MSDPVEVWERFSRADERHVPVHRRKGSATPSTPSARLLELTQELSYTRQCLAEAIAEVKRLRKLAR